MTPKDHFVRVWQIFSRGGGLKIFYSRGAVRIPPLAISALFHRLHTPLMITHLFVLISERTDYLCMQRGRRYQTFILSSNKAVLFNKGIECSVV